jgi:hemerythrin-like metal-binding protein
MDKERYKYYQVGVEKVDEEHLQIFAILENMKWKYTEVDDVILLSLISQLQTVLEIHCKTEEEFMASFEYPYLEAHKESHGILISFLKRRLATVVKHKDSAKYVAEEIIKEFQNHIEWYDLQYADYKKRYKQT